MKRKDDHIKYALNQKTTSNSFDNYELEYYSIPELELDDIDISTNICGIDFEFPFFINAITGGSKKGDQINKMLEEISNKTGIFLFPGSYSPFLSMENNNYPKFKGSNLGIDKDYKKHLEACENTNSLIHQVHINPIQEILMPEGNTNFKDWKVNLKNILKYSSIPIILKETGFGMNEKTILTAIDLGIRAIDISGKDGTDFSKIENMRNKNPKYYFEEIGYSTTDSLINAQKFQDKIDIIASGGIRNPIDIVKALALGAKFVGISKTFLKILEESGKDKLIETIQEWKKDIKYIMILTNSKNIYELKGKVRIKNDK